MNLRVNDILDAVLEHCGGMPISDLIDMSCKDRRRHTAREAAVGCLRELLQLSYPEVARIVGYRCHTGAWQAMERWNRKWGSDERAALLAKAFFMWKRPDHRWSIENVQRICDEQGVPKVRWKARQG